MDSYCRYVAKLILCAIGGCTRGEVLSLRQLAQDADDGSSYLVATTGYISGHVLMRSLQVKWD